jgi:hypothetical protein
MKAALEILGYAPTFHAFAFLHQMRDVEMWRQGIEAKFFPERAEINPFGRVQFDQLLGDYRALCGAPAIIFAPELISAYPDAKIVLVERDIESWYKSFDKAMIQTTFSPAVIMISKLDRVFMYQVRCLAMTMFQGFYRSSTKQELASNAKVIYREHYNNIRRITEKDRLLEFKLQDGWKPLCEFLEKPIPDCPFPRKNDSEDVREKVLVLLWLGLMRIIRGAALVLGSFWLVLLGIYGYMQL